MGITHDKEAVQAILLVPWVHFDAQYACYLNAKFLLQDNQILVRPYGDNGLDIVIMSPLLNFKIKAVFDLQPVTCC